MEWSSGSRSKTRTRGRRSMSMSRRRSRHSSKSNTATMNGQANQDKAAYGVRNASTRSSITNASTRSCINNATTKSISTNASTRSSSAAHGVSNCCYCLYLYLRGSWFLYDHRVFSSCQYLSFFLAISIIFLKV